MPDSFKPVSQLERARAEVSGRTEGRVWGMWSASGIRYLQENGKVGFCDELVTGGSVKRASTMV